jgi:hypothetical protein
MRKEVRVFANEMERVLKLNDYKEHWSSYSEEYLIGRLKKEVAELERALSDRCENKDCNGIVYINMRKVSGECRYRVVQEAADVASFAMMIADLNIPKAKP